MPSSKRWPPDEAVIQAIHDRYQLELIEGLGLCPFARRSRELGRVHRPLFVVTDSYEPSALEVARGLGSLVEAEPEAEIVLLTFPIPPRHRWWQPSAFEEFLFALRAAWAAAPRPREFYMVSFHPRFDVPADHRLTADSLVPLLRRSPDPVVQCVDTNVLDRVRREAQASARERMLRDLEQRSPALLSLFESSVAADPELSSDIAQQNFGAHGQGVGRAALERAIEALLRDRDRAYGVASDE